MENIFNIIIEDSKKTVAKYGAVAKKLPWVLARHAFLFILLFVVLEAVIGTFLFYAYIFVPKTKNTEMVDSPETFQEKTYRSVLEAWEKRDAIIESSPQEEYNDPFQ
ncbi:MAG: hypothetical protein A3C50_02265 [Candidatus Staskawiczbacteria bacterium RIFCSPHIGHO2_02_FULL_43_16]|uniref:Uncharacterized protein n=1 Tax=Candidatus Staskawiczbacteria bacterium RIFCSPHIGHO2_01_FULL_41_41 TaxID=1802203 RepID=A0A1G2HWB2_9BACT|nr:MAG: hypothetical protein A2822_00635 [Candidatus Staskawiczbacteria bacterium RIFCSPHIGHO2_01_FULL_41_41]OGZ68502.1 MAG: hypothetical protein A3C50_02265 [Candidatus Staskawiczbacteria bacterium RIFCSPHIGHO2_02_FULL_43_16]OGZ74306.1 MAG: hypothetical protein A3A12_02700 [Candidatus Staskawiczbacteria bacterium RIFCSPLOWO2_01_FULL_43_17b]